MLNLYSYIQDSKIYRKLEVDELLFVEYKCVYEETRAGIWSELNYFVFVTSGKKMWKSINHDYLVEAGDSLFVKKGANLVHQYFEEDYCALMVFIPDDFIRKFMQRFAESIRTPGSNQLPGDSVIRVQLDQFLKGYVDSLAAFLGGHTFPDKTLLQLKFEELLLNIFTRPVHQEVARYLNSLNKEQSAQLEQVMEANFAYNMKLEEYASLCNLSLSTFKRLFTTVYNMSPGKWLAEKRLNLAAHLLRTSDKNIGQVSFESGFEDPSSFIRAFKNKFELTPLQYRSNAN